MPKIKLIKIHSRNKYDYDDYDDNLVKEPISDWLTVTDEELEYLTSYNGRKILEKNCVKIVIYEDITSEEAKIDYITDIKKFIKTEKEKQEKLEKKRKQEAQARKEAARLRKIQKAKTLLEQEGIT